MAEFTDRQLTCVECNNEFTFSAGEQQRHQELGFTNEPKRCAPCRQARKARAGGGGGFSGVRSDRREMFDVICGDCGQAAQVPFKPRGDRPVYCSTCFDKHKQG